jgi:hypothetical protein
MKILQLTVLMAGLCISAFNSEAQPSFLTNGLVAYYPFNGNANDASGNGNNLINNGATYGRDMFGNSNGAAYFNAGSSTPPYGDFDNNFGGQWMSFGNAKPIDNLSALSVSMWLKPGNFLPPAYGNASASRILYQETVLGLADSGNAPQGIGVGVGNGTIDVWEQPGLNITNGTFGFSENGAWFHFVYTADATGEYLYANGVLASSYTNSSFQTGTNSYTLGVGAYYNGAIDNLRIYNRALSSSEVAKLYTIESELLNIQKAVYLNTYNLSVGSNYQLQFSSDLLKWSNYGGVFTATNNYWQSTNYWNVSNWNQLFFRLLPQ